MHGALASPQQSLHQGGVSSDRSREGEAGDQRAEVKNSACTCSADIDRKFQFDSSSEGIGHDPKGQLAILLSGFQDLSSPGSRTDRWSSPSRYTCNLPWQLYAQHKPHMSSGACYWPPPYMSLCILISLPKQFYYPTKPQ